MTPAGTNAMAGHAFSSLRGHDGWRAPTIGLTDPEDRHGKIRAQNLPGVLGAYWRLRQQRRIAFDVCVEMHPGTASDRPEFC
jgi:hypothetical protein